MKPLIALAMDSSDVEYYNEKRLNHRGYRKLIVCTG